MIKIVIKKLAQTIIENEDLLTSLDRAIGDADHGNNMALGFQAFLAQMDAISNNTQAVFKKLGITLMSKVGGASGPLYGMSFLKGSEAFLETKNTYNFSEFKNFVNNFTTSIMKLGNAKARDKTMLDVWLPLNEKLKMITKLDKEMLVNDIDDFAKATIPLQALRGRASYLGKRSIGHKDPGATSSAIILTHLVNGIEP